MARVTLIARLPSVRVGLAAMLTQQGHALTDGADGTGAVWVLDDPDADQLAALLEEARGSADEPPGLVVLTDEPGLSAVLLAAGLRGWACLERDADMTDLDLAVRAVAANLVLLASPFAAQLPASSREEKSAAVSSDPLTPREMQVLQLVAQGLPNKAIAHALGISENTAKYHVGSLTGKLGAGSRTEAVATAARRGLIVL